LATGSESGLLLWSIATRTQPTIVGQIETGGSSVASVKFGPKGVNIQSLGDGSVAS
jgi:hypothetical protein